MPLFIIVIVVLMVVSDLAWWRHADGKLRPLARATLWRGLLEAFMGFQVIALLWALLTPRALETAVVPFALTFIWHLFVLPIALVAILFGSICSATRWCGVWAWRRSRPAAAPPVTEPATRDTSDDVLRLSRRAVLLRATAAAAPPLLATVGTARAAAQLDDFRINRLEVGVPALPPELDGLTITHVSDPHVGDFTNGRTLTRIADATNALRSDLVLLTGDLINRRLSDLPAALDMIRRMDPRQGLFMCEGNHDLFEGRAAFAAGARQADVPLLVNESSIVRVRGRDVQVLGLRWGGGAGDARSRDGGDTAIADTLPPLLDQIRPGAFPILLAHHPHAFDLAATARVPLTLAGHTHGGQLNLLPNVGFGRLMYRYWSGLYARGDSRLVVSNGVGNWFPLRVNAPAEIVHLTLRCPA